MENEAASDRLLKIAGRLPGVVYQYRLRPDGSSCFPFASEALTEIYRVRPEDVRDDASRIFACIHPDDYDGVVASILTSAHELTQWQHEYRVKFEDGAIRSLYGNAAPERESDGSILWHGYITDITERKEVAKTLNESEEKFRRLFDTMPNGFYRSTPEGYYVDVNLAFVKMLGYDSKEELLKVFIPTDIYVRPVEREEFARENENFINNLEVYRLKTKDGRIIWLEDHARYIKDENGKVIYNEGICRDITDRKRVEAEIKLQNEKLLKINAEKDKFFSIIAHDLRGPFNSFLGLTKIMAEELPTLTMAEIQMFAISLENSAISLYRLLENLLQWAKIQQGLIPFNQEFENLLQVAEESIEMMLETAKCKKIDILKNIPDHLEVFADNNMLQTVIRNLVSNAVKFTAQGGKINLSAKSSGDEFVEIVVRDSGIGMNRDLRENLFRLDVQTNRKGTDGEPSTGLGLILCKEFIEKHGGKLWVESEVGSGSAFYFTLPSKKHSSKTAL